VISPNLRITFICLCVFLFAYSLSYAQKIATFQKSFGVSNNADDASSVLALPDKGFLISGISYTAPPYPVYKIWIIRTDSLGKQIWGKTYAGTGAGNDATGDIDDAYLSNAVDMALSPEGNVVVCSNTNNQTAIYLFKINLNGTVLWSKTFPSNNKKEETLGTCIINAPGGGYMITGCMGIASTLAETIIIKTDSAGNAIWSKIYDQSGYGGCGFCIAPARDGSYLICGVSDSVYGGPAYGKDLIMKINKNGNLLWSRIYTDFKNDQSANSILELPDRTIYVCGIGESPSGEGGILIKLDSAGKLLWSKIYVKGDTLTDGEFGSIIYDSLKKTINISYEYAAPVKGGERNGIIRLDTSGDFIFIKSYGPQTMDYNYRAIGHNFIKLPTGFALLQNAYATLLKGNSYDYYYLVKMDSGANAHGCNTSSSTKSVTNYPIDYLYSYTAASMNLDTGSGCVVTSVPPNDSFFCAPFVTKFGWKDSCSNSFVQFLDSSYYQPISWQWNFGDSLSSSNTSTAQDPVHTYSKPGVYKVTLVSSNGDITDSFSRKITILQGVQPFVLDTLVCNSDSVPLKISPSGATYLWNDGDTLQNRSVPPGTWWAKVSLANSCWATDTFHIVNPGSLRLGNDTTICTGDTLTLNIGYPEALWSTGATGPAIEVTQAGKYWVSVGNGKCMVSDTIVVKTRAVSIGTRDTTICQGGSFILKTGYAGTIWSNGDTGANIWVSNAGIYWAKLNRSTCKFTDTVTVRETYLSAALKPFYSSCNKPVTLDPGPDTNATFKWSTGDTSQTISVNQSGKYWVQVDKKGCAVSDTTEVSTAGFIGQNTLPKDTVLCSGALYPIDLSSRGANNAVWSDSVTGLRRTITKPGQYIVTLSTATCKETDSMDVSYDTASFKIGSVLCQGAPYLLYGPTWKGADYLWNTGSKNNIITITQSGPYWLTVQYEKCPVSDTITVNIDSPLVVNLGGNRSLCDSSLILNTGHNRGALYKWSNGDSDTTIRVINSGKYWVAATNQNGCKASDTATITLNAIPVFTGDNLKDTAFCSEEGILVLDAGVAYKYLWSPGGDTSRKINITDSGTFMVKISSAAGCTTSKTITITDDCTPHLFIPNAFSPDSEGINGTFKAYGLNIASFSMGIYNRWGEKIFSSNDITKGWDGRFKGSICNSGIYIYIIRYATDEQPSTTLKRNGTVYLMR